ncbi:amidohydrolase [Mycolicibacterium aubagnense]
MNGKVDLIVFNGRVRRMDGAHAPVQTAVAIANGKIRAIGTDDDVLCLRMSATELIDAEGGSILPGFNENHMHLFFGATKLSHLNLSDVKGYEALAKAISAFAAQHPDAPLISGLGVAYDILGERGKLDRHMLDRILPDRPVLLSAPDFHAAWANTVALRKAGILHGAQLPPGNEIVMEPEGTASGELHENDAIKPVEALGGGRETLALHGMEPSPTLSERALDKATLRRGLDHCARLGITSIQNMDGNLYQAELLEELYREGNLSCRVRLPFSFVQSMDLTSLEKACWMHERYQSDWLRSGQVKLFMDGVPESWTALMHEDYADRPGWRGEPRFTEDGFNTIVKEADRRGLQVAVHAIGDEAVHRVLNGFEAARHCNGARDSRHRVEHVDITLDDDVERFAHLGAIASFQPLHAPGHGLPSEPVLSRFGRNNWRRAYAWKRFRDAGVRMVFSSDWPVVSVDPLQSLHCAMTCRPLGEDLPDNRQTLDQALAAYTCDAAYAEFTENRKGRLALGYHGDITVLDKDIAAVEPEAITEMRCVATICGGKVMHRASSV